MNSDTLISFIEAERAKIDPKHRTLELDHFAYGLIARVLAAIYQDKKVVEAAALRPMDPTMLAHNVPSVTRRRGASKHVPFKMQVMLNGVMRGVNFDPATVERDGKPGYICAICGEWCENKSNSPTFTCDKRECIAALSRSALQARRDLALGDKLGQSRTCINCKNPFVITRAGHLNYITCPIEADRGCAAQVHSHKQNYNNWKNAGAVMPAPTAKQAAAVEFMARYREERAKYAAPSA